MERFNRDIEAIYSKLVKGVSTFFRQQWKERAVIGLSGGIDSAVVFVIAVEALGRDKVHPILMPSPFSTIHSVTDSVELAGNLQIEHSVVPIDDIYNRYLRELEELFSNNIKDLTLENLQARIRGDILMAYSNNSGALLLNNTNKSELAVGYGTLYGDLCGAIMVIGDLYKLQIYSLANYINRKKEIIPRSIITKEPSAELKDDQKDSDSLPKYDILDPILLSLIEEGKGVAQLIEEGANPAVVNEVIALMESSRFKIAQLPPLLQIGEHPLLPPDKCFNNF
ncbi:MAG: NAD(+) synthase [Bacteroidales bacterium]